LRADVRPGDPDEPADRTRTLSTRPRHRGGEDRPAGTPAPAGGSRHPQRAWGAGGIARLPDADAGCDRTIAAADPNRKPFRRFAEGERMSIVVLTSMLHEPAAHHSATRLFRGRPVLRWMLERISQSERLARPVVLCWEDQ